MKFKTGKLSQPRSRFADAFGAETLSHPRSRFAGAFGAFAVLLAIVLTAILALRVMAPPKALPTGAPATEFSAERAFELLKGIAAEPHALGTPAHDTVRDLVLRMWRDLGFEPEIQAGLVLGAAEHYAARVENILARLPGTKPTPGGALMLATHYDSVEAAPGAADDGSGVVTLLETARALKAGPPLAEDVLFLVTDAEEDGLLGARLFQDEHPRAKDVGLVLNFEARGTAGPALMFQTSAENERLIAALAATPHPRAYSFGAAIYRSMPNDTDLTIWLESRAPGLELRVHRSGRQLPYGRRQPGGPRPAESPASRFLRVVAGPSFRKQRPAPAGSGRRGPFQPVRRPARPVLQDIGVPPRRNHRGSPSRRRRPGVGAPEAPARRSSARRPVHGRRHASFRRLGIRIHGRGRSGPSFVSARRSMDVQLRLFPGPGLSRGRRDDVPLWRPGGRPEERVRDGFRRGGPLALPDRRGDPAGGGRELPRRAGPPSSWRSPSSSGPGADSRRKNRAWRRTSGAPRSTALGIVLVAVPLLVLFFETMFLTPLMAAIQAILVAMMLAAASPALEVMRRGLGRALPILCVGVLRRFRHRRRPDRQVFRRDSAPGVPATFPGLRYGQGLLGDPVPDSRSLDEARGGRRIPGRRSPAGIRRPAGRVLLPRCPRLVADAPGNPPDRGPGSGLVPFPPVPGRLAERRPPDCRLLPGGRTYGSGGGGPTSRPRPPERQGLPHDLPEPRAGRLRDDSRSRRREARSGDRPRVESRTPRPAGLRPRRRPRPASGLTASTPLLVKSFLFPPPEPIEQTAR